MSKQACQFKGCKKIHGVNKHFYRFPKDNDRSLDWILHSGNDNLIDLPPMKLREKRICSDHFSDDAFTNSLKNRLVHNACPVMYTIKNDLPISRIENVHGDTPQSRIPAVETTDTTIKKIEKSSQILLANVRSAKNATDEKINSDKSVVTVDSNNSDSKKTLKRAAIHCISKKKILLTFKLKLKLENKLQTNKPTDDLFS